MDIKRKHAKDKNLPEMNMLGWQVTGKDPIKNGIINFSISNQIGLLVARFRQKHPERNKSIRVEISDKISDVWDKKKYGNLKDVLHEIEDELKVSIVMNSKNCYHPTIMYAMGELIEEEKTENNE